MADPPARSRCASTCCSSVASCAIRGTVGAVAPSSRALAREMVRRARAGHARRSSSSSDRARARSPSAIVERLRPGDRLLAVELEPAFVEQLRDRWPSLDCVCASATELVELVARATASRPVDHIVSGLPFASLPAATSRQVLDGDSARAASGRHVHDVSVRARVHAAAAAALSARRRRTTRRSGVALDRVSELSAGVRAAVAPRAGKRLAQTPG